MSDHQLDTADKKASYGIGLQMGQQLAQSGLDGLNVEAIAQGILTVLAKEEPLVPLEEINAALQDVHARAEEAKKAASEMAASDGASFLKDNALRSEVTVLESGLQYEVLQQGDGPIPTADQKVRVHYHGELVNGEVFDSSVARNHPAEFQVTAVIKGWVEALQMMPVGSKWKLFIPHELAYGEHGAGSAIPPFSTLCFEVELLDIL